MPNQQLTTKGVRLMNEMPNAGLERKTWAVARILVCISIAIVAAIMAGLLLGKLGDPGSVRRMFFVALLPLSGAGLLAVVQRSRDWREQPQKQGTLHWLWALAGILVILNCTIALFGLR